MSTISFKSPCTGLICGPTGCGKSQLVFNMLKDLDILFDKKVEKIYYFYSVWQNLFDKCNLQNITFINKKPDEKFIKEIANGDHCVLIIDDFQMSALKDEFIANLFTRESHHRNLSVFIILQNLFHQGKYSRDISLNAQYFILFRNPRDKYQIKVLGKQLGLNNKLEEAYNLATIEPFSYLLIDLSPQCEVDYMLRSHILPEDYTVIYK